MAICFKPYLRKKLLQYGWKRTADCLVPDIKGEVRTMSVKVAELEAFLAKQKLPRIKDIAPEIKQSDVYYRKRDVIGSGGYGYVLRGTFREQPVAIKAMFGDDSQGIPESVPPCPSTDARVKQRAKKELNNKAK